VTRGYRKALVEDPSHAASLHRLGIAAHQAGRNGLAAQLIARAIAADKGDPLFHHNLGIILTSLGRWPEALAAYDAALRLRADIVPAHSNRGSLLRELGKLDAALPACRRALVIAPDFTAAYANLGNVRSDQGREDEAAKAFGRAIRLDGLNAEAHYNLGNALNNLGRFPEAAAAYKMAAALRPAFAEPYANLGNALQSQTLFDPAPYIFALRLKPHFAKAFNNMGNALLGRARLDPAAAAFRSAICLLPDYAEPYCGLGIVQRSLRHLKDSLVALDRAVGLRPDLSRAHANRGNSLKELGRFDDSMSAHGIALALDPALAEAYSNRGSVLQELGRMEEAAAAFEAAVTIKPDNAEAFSNLLFLRAAAPRGDYLELARRWERQCVASGVGGAKFPARRPGRLRIGYVSGDYCRHAVAYFIEQLFTHHDRGKVELFAYSTAPNQDEVTLRLRRLVEHWRPLAGLSDSAARQRIMEDGIDVLIDLSGHTANNRLGVFARRAAPVQAHYLGYFASTGLSQMDYWIGDRVITPPENDRDFRESVWRLPRSWVCYDGSAEAPPPAWRSAPDGSVWLGSFNRLSKLTPQSLALWARILREMPEARLLLKTGALESRAKREEILAAFAAHGVAAERLELQGGATASWAAHMAAYDRLDLALDPIGGVGGGTTSCDALWMGAPLIALAGDRMATRMTMSMLNSIGRGEWIAADEDAYVAKVIELGRDVEARRAMRAGQRDLMAKSDLCDPRGLAAALETAYAAMTERVTAGGRGSS